MLAVDEFIAEMKKVAKESFRVLKKGKMCAVMIGDVRKYGKVIPLGFRVMECFLQAIFCFLHMSIYLFFRSKSTYKE